jgi:MoxR-like ATPase
MEREGQRTEPSVVTIRVFNSDSRERDQIARSLFRQADRYGFKLLLVVAGDEKGDAAFVHSVGCTESSRSLGEMAIEVFNPANRSLEIYQYQGLTSSQNPKAETRDLGRDVLIDHAELDRVLAAWRKSKCLIVEGAPGVGKSHAIQFLANGLADPKVPVVESIQFHQSSTYEDFVGGWRPDESGFVWRAGTIVAFAERARRETDRPHVLVIDEMNRGNVSKIFGEMLTLIEGSKRSLECAVAVPNDKGLPEPFYLPDNLFLLGLMNTADRTLAVLDFALRRRFLFWRLRSQLGNPEFLDYLLSRGVDSSFAERLNDAYREANRLISANDALGEGFEIGHAYFCDGPEESQDDADWYREIHDLRIVPLVREYSGGDLQFQAKLLKVVSPGALSNGAPPADGSGGK